MADHIERLKLDVERIRQANDRTGKLAEKAFRWEGCKDNPNGWRLLGDLADDLEALIKDAENAKRRTTHRNRSQ